MHSKPGSQHANPDHLSQERISKAVSPIRAAQFLQIENQMALFVDVTSASEMPTVKAGPAAGK